MPVDSGCSIRATPPLSAGFQTPTLFFCRLTPLKNGTTNAKIPFFKGSLMALDVNDGIQASVNTRVEDGE